MTFHKIACTHIHIITIIYRNVGSVIKVQKKICLRRKRQSRRQTQETISWCRSGSMNSSHTRTADCQHTTSSTHFHLFCFTLLNYPQKVMNDLFSFIVTCGVHPKVLPAYVHLLSVLFSHAGHIIATINYMQ